MFAFGMVVRVLNHVKDKHFGYLLSEQVERPWGLNLQYLPNYTPLFKISRIIPEYTCFLLLHIGYHQNIDINIPFEIFSF